MGEVTNMNNVYALFYRGIDRRVSSAIYDINRRLENIERDMQRATCLSCGDEMPSHCCNCTCPNKLIADEAKAGQAEEPDGSL
jgi:hypothetical protein